jgi:hypothetical protein
LIPPRIKIRSPFPRRPPLDISVNKDSLSLSHLLFLGGFYCWSSVPNDDNHARIEFRALLTQYGTKLQLVEAGP